MSTFSHHHHPFLLDQTTTFHPYPTTHNFSGHQPATAAAMAAACYRQTKNLQSQGSSTPMEVDGGTHDQIAMKRKDNNNGISQDTRKGKKKKQKKNSGDEGAVGYIHVRARSGQATDSHSLAERVRRQKINERMKLLQSIVPGCDQVTAKTLMLDQIINYVHSLQNQVELLSMKLASANPMLCELEVGLDSFMLRSHQNVNGNMVIPFMPNLQQYKPILTEGNSGFNTRDDNSTPNIHPKVLWDMEKQIGDGNNTLN